MSYAYEPHEPPPAQLFRLQELQSQAVAAQLLPEPVAVGSVKRGAFLLPSFVLCPSGHFHDANHGLPQLFGQGLRARDAPIRGNRGNNENIANYKYQSPISAHRSVVDNETTLAPRDWLLSQSSRSRASSLESQLVQTTLHHATSAAATGTVLWSACRLEMCRSWTTDYISLPHSVF